MGARRAWLEGFVLTDHGPALPGGTHPYHFGNMRVLPDRIRGVRFYRGIEANVLDLEGNLDLDDRGFERLHFVMAGLHEACFAPRSAEENTKALVMALRNPRVDAISHPGNPLYPVNIDELVEEARAQGKALEINNSSFKVRAGSADACLEIARACARTGTRVVVGSDAHYWRDVGNFAAASKVLRAARMPRELVVNASLRSFEAFIGRRANAV